MHKNKVISIISDASTTENTVFALHNTYAIGTDMIAGQSGYPFQEEFHGLSKSAILNTGVLGRQ
jgi:hypothetical protein